MEQVGVRELRQRTSELLRRAGAGERIEITRRGQVVALLVPPVSPGGRIARLVADGRLRPAAATAGPLPAPVATAVPASAALAELRRDER